MKAHIKQTSSVVLTIDDIDPVVWEQFQTLAPHIANHIANVICACNGSPDFFKKGDLADLFRAMGEK